VDAGESEVNPLTLPRFGYKEGALVPHGADIVTQIGFHGYVIVAPRNRHFHNFSLKKKNIKKTPN
jgi:hypothetical protein